MKSRAYASMNVNAVNVQAVLKGREGKPASLGMDMSKDEVMVMLRWGDGDFDGAWRVQNPAQIPQGIELMKQLSAGRELRIAMEPTGTYGDALRQAMHRAALKLERVGTKASHDYAEVFDGVPSQHDGKDAAIVAELCSIGKSSPWPYERPGEPEQRMAELVEWMDVQRKLMTMWLGCLEALLARHWPEASRIVELKSMTLLRALCHYGGPAAMAADPQAGGRLRRWGGSLLSQGKIDALVASAAGTLGVEQTAVDVRRLRHFARRAFAARQMRMRCRRELQVLAARNPVIEAMGQVTGVATACVLWVCLGDPRHYASAYAYRKAMGLNLAERSSGRWKGHLKISKRGKAMVRRWLYLSALRKLTHPGVQRWYEQSRTRHGGKAGAALIGIMRKLSLAVYLAAQGEVFDAGKLFAASSASTRNRR